ncbi:MAG: hypothetical protein KF850_41865 [Labilithrix sp.]|nr:hypothetical protein [Labilithrix sp.]MBX3218627.1 hypothetical protein [Labilithrix sp.]
MRAAAGLVALVAGCAGPPSPPSAPAVPNESSSPAEPAAPATSTRAVDPAPSGSQDASAVERACDVGEWDAVAKRCAVPPRGAAGAPGGWAGCTQASAPQGAPCFTGTRWVSADCACACDGATTWSEGERRCR